MITCFNLFLRGKIIVDSRAAAANLNIRFLVLEELKPKFNIKKLTSSYLSILLGLFRPRYISQFSVCLLSDLLV